MTEGSSSNALKHGVFSEITILPGEDPQTYKKLKAALFTEYKPSGRSEKDTITSIAKALWQERRLALYQHVQILRAQKSGSAGAKNDPLSGSMSAMAQIIEKFSHEGRASQTDYFPKVIVPDSISKKSTDDELLELGNLITLEQLEKELDVESKLHAKIDRLFRRFFQMKAMKPMVGLGQTSAPSLMRDEPVLELTAAQPEKPAEE